MTTFALLPLPEGGGALSWPCIARSPFWLKNARFLFPSSFPSLRSFLAVSSSQLTPPVSKPSDPECKTECEHQDSGLVVEIQLHFLLLYVIKREEDMHCTIGPESLASLVLHLWMMCWPI